MHSPSEPAAVAAATRVAPESFEARYRVDADPWNLATSAYERDKYAHTIAALGAATFARALELGCSIGVLTEALAASCRALVAVDTSPTAIAAARDRMSGTLHVLALTATIPEELPPGPWDLVVASEILYYFDRGPLGHVMDALEAEMADGGTLLAVHYTGEAPDHRLTGDEVHEILAGRPRLRRVDAAQRTGYRLDRFELA